MRCTEAPVHLSIVQTISKTWLAIQTGSDYRNDSARTFRSEGENCTEPLKFLSRSTLGAIVERTLPWQSRPSRGVGTGNTFAAEHTAGRVLTTKLPVPSAENLLPSGSPSWPGYLQPHTNAQILSFHRCASMWKGWDTLNKKILTPKFLKLWTMK